MAANAMILFLLLIYAISSTKAQQKNLNIVLGSSLSPTKNPHWLSDSGHFAFGFYPKAKGFAVGVWFAGAPPQRTVVWTANRDDPPLSGDASLLLTTDGTLVLKQSQGEEMKISNASMAAASASMLDSGNFVLYSSDSDIIWQSFDFPTTTILPGQSLKAGQELVSGVSKTNQETGKFRIKMQIDGNLVQYPVETSDETDYAYWATDTFTAGDNVSLNLDSGGNLYLVNTTGFEIMNLYDRRNVSNGAFFRVSMDADRIFRLNSFDQNQRWVIEWSSSTNKCDPIGLCGLNSYCALQNQGPVCVCPPGFDFIDPADKNLGCTTNFSTGVCLSKKKFNTDEEVFDVEELDAIDWEDNPYSIVSSTTIAECKNDCLSDCNCEAAIFKHLECRKQKLPLRFGRIHYGQQVTTMIKVGTGNLVPTTLIKGKTQLRMDIFITGIAFLLTGIIVLAISGCLIYRYKVGKYAKISSLEKDGFAEDVNLQKFSYSELEKATNGFRDEVGKGASGTVFKGTVSNGKRLVAIKRLEKAAIEGDEREFLNQIKVIGRTHHKNLVRLLGYCCDQTNRLLVYEFMSNGTLADAIFRSEKKPNWEERKNIALNIARGILYLHEECTTQIIHGDIKPENIMIGERGSVQIADSGLPKLLNPQQVTKNRIYMAPEWRRNMPITVKSDVYSFGIMLLEIVCCRRSVVDMDVLIWVYDCLEGNKVEREKVERIVQVGLWCIQGEPNFRPGMKKVVMMLEGTVEIPPPPCPRSFQSSI